MRTPIQFLRNFSTSFAAWRRRHWLALGAAITFAICVLGILPGLADAKREEAIVSLVSTQLELPPLPERAELDVATLTADEAMNLALQGEADGWHSAVVESGDTLAALFARQGFSPRDLNRALEAQQVQEIAGRLRPGKRIAFFAPEAGRLHKLLFDNSDTSRVLVHLDEADGVREEILERQLQYRVEQATGQIDSSLFAAAEDAGLSNVMVLKVAKVLGYDIDFAQDLRIGDRFHVIYEQVYDNGHKVRDGDVLAVSFINRGTRYVALRHVHPDGKIEYYDQDGRPLRKEFLRTPVDFTRISSRFNLARKHPVLNRVRAHRGVDYAAPTGTPVYAAGAGRITFRGRQGGYGNTVIIDHGRGYTTLYAHLSRFHGNASVGSRVRQGDIIGYVGMTGLATGPHLHYEFRVKGMHRDPLTVTLPKPEPLKGRALERFRRDSAALAGQLERLEALRTLAAN